jgi:hypothetical protein
MQLHYVLLFVRSYDRWWAEGGAHFALAGRGVPACMTVWSHGAQTQRIDEPLSLRWAGVSRSALRSLLLTDGGDIEPIRWLRVPSRALLGGVLCINRYFRHRAGALRQLPLRSCSQRFGPMAGWL